MMIMILMIMTLLFINSANNDDHDSIGAADTYHIADITICDNGAVTDYVDSANERGTNKV